MSLLRPDVIKQQKPTNLFSKTGTCLIWCAVIYYSFCASYAQCYVFIHHMHKNIVMFTNIVSVII